ncbi:MAG: ATP-dependent Clp protease ATP-binding subunit [Oscillospiraceae bacterium]|nr:ATP-dependent Clp protease ATP-binding subunit [Oscillospiraceae bacterium]
MKQRQFTAKARTAILLAWDNAERMGHCYVGSEHLLLGLLQTAGSTAAELLDSSGLREDKLTEAVSTSAGLGAPGSISLGVTARFRTIIRQAAAEASGRGKKQIGTIHLLAGVVSQREGGGVMALRAAKVDQKRLYTSVFAYLGGESYPNPKNGRARESEPVRDSRLMEQFSRDLTWMAGEGRLDPVSGRDRELRRVIQILIRRSKNNPVLIGEAGVGKTAIVEELARRVRAGQVPELLRGKRILAIDLPAMVAGTKYRGEFEERMKRLTTEVQRAGNIILFLDELHTLVGAGSAEGAIDASNILKPALSRGELQIIGATTREEYRKHIEKDSALERRFQPVQVDEPTRADAINILNVLRSRYEMFHHLSITDDAVRSAVDLSIRYLPDRFLPDKAVDLMDEAAAAVRMRASSAPPELDELKGRLTQAEEELDEAVAVMNFERAALLRDAVDNFHDQYETAKNGWQNGLGTLSVTGKDVARIVSQWTGVPVQNISKSEAARLLNLEKELHRRVIGQDEAISAIAAAIRRSRAGLQEGNRPVGSFLFCGTSGVGKTELCKALAEALYGGEGAMVRFDMSEYREPNSVSRLVGSPPGYVGFEEGGQLTRKIRQKPYSVVLFDELEKAHEEVCNLLLQILEDGRLTDNVGRVADFRNTVIVMTSNAGAERLLACRAPLGFQGGGDPSRLRRETVLSVLRQTFRPELLGRVDEIVCFQPLSQTELCRIAGKLLEDVGKRLRKKGIVLRYTQAAVELIAASATPESGARPLRVKIREDVENPAAELLLRGRLSRGDTLLVNANGGGLTVQVEGRKPLPGAAAV